MDKLLSLLSREEIVSLKLRALYERFGYCQYKMSKFEEYDLYASNKDFLVSSNVITFTDVSGKLLALKPDVTLSIIKNTKDNPTELTKVYYDEHVYRVSQGDAFKEIKQAGVECLGNVKLKAVSEALALAGKSLDVVSSSAVLEVSHLSVVTGVINALGFSQDASLILKYLGEKNVNAIKKLCEERGASERATIILCKLSSVYGEYEKVENELAIFEISKQTKKAVGELKSATLKAQKQTNAKIVIDFSVVNNMNYYNGIAFKGYVEGVPQSVLSGGQYDGLMEKMGKKSQGVGFAVYLDALK